MALSHCIGSAAQDCLTRAESAVTLGG